MKHNLEMDIKIEPYDDFLSANTSENSYYCDKSIKNEDHYIEIKCEALEPKEEIVDEKDVCKPIKCQTTNSISIDLPDIPSKTWNENNQVSGHIKTKMLENEKIAVILLKKSVFHKQNFVCSVCFDVLPSPVLLQQHKSVHKLKYSSKNTLIEPFNEQIDTDEQLIGCDECSFKAKHLSQIKLHKISHIKAQIYKCDQCNYQSVHSFNIKTHKRSHTGEKPFACDQCNYKTAYVSHLKNHKRSHTGEKPFKCDQCNYKTVQSYNLKTHKRLHTGEKPFGCDVCDYKSAYFAHLKMHKMSHTGEKPYKCGICPYESVNSWNLKAHTTSHASKKSLK